MVRSNNKYTQLGGDSLPSKIDPYRIEFRQGETGEWLHLPRDTDIMFDSGNMTKTVIGVDIVKRLGLHVDEQCNVTIQGVGGYHACRGRGSVKMRLKYPYNVSEMVDENMDKQMRSDVYDIVFYVSNEHPTTIIFGHDGALDQLFSNKYNIQGLYHVGHPSYFSNYINRELVEDYSKRIKSKNNPSSSTSTSTSTSNFTNFDNVSKKYLDGFNEFLIVNELMGMFFHSVKVCGPTFIQKFMEAKEIFVDAMLSCPDSHLSIQLQSVDIDDQFFEFLSLLLIKYLISIKYFWDEKNFKNRISMFIVNIPFYMFFLLISDIKIAVSIIPLKYQAIFGNILETYQWLTGAEGIHHNKISDVKYSNEEVDEFAENFSINIAEFMSRGYLIHTTKLTDPKDLEKVRCMCKVNANAGKSSTKHINVLQ